MKICSVKGCGKRHKARGFCARHYFRWGKHGDPSVGAQKTERGAARLWLLAHVDYADDACLIWPFTTTTKGYPSMKWDGRTAGAHRVMCELAHGPAPTPEHEVAHFCGNGKIGCINQKHLRWATTSDNHAEKENHGTLLYGSKLKHSKLTEDDIVKIRALFSTRTDIQIASQFGVSDSAIYQIRVGKSWRRVA